MNAFRPAGNTILVVASSSTGVAATQWSSTLTAANMTVAWTANTGAVPVYLAFGSSSVAAAIPTTSGNPGLTFPSSYAKALSVGPGLNAWVSAVTSAGTANVYLTPGDGF